MVEKIKVEVVYAFPQEQTLLTVNVEEGSDVEHVIFESGILQQYPEIDLEKNKVGVF
jgi:hypothetical protein